MITHRIVAYLISLAVGYWVLTLAEKEKNTNKKIGKVVGWIIIVVSLIGPLCITGSRVFCHGSSCSYMQSCPWGGSHGMWNCPDMMKGSGAAGDQGEKSK